MKNMELSGLELYCLIKDINQKLSQGYYVGTISSISKNSFSLKMRHPNLSDILVILSTAGIWITKMNFRTFEDSPIINSMKSEIERAKFESIEQVGDERVAYLKFKHLDGRIRILIAEFFRKGNVIICNENNAIISILNPVEVRHRILRPGMAYQSPPLRGINIFELSLEDLLNLRNTEKDQSIEVEKWLGRNISLSKKYIEEIVAKAKIKHTRLRDTTRSDIETIVGLTRKLVFDVCDPSAHKPLVVLDNAGQQINVIPFRFDSISEGVAFVPHETLMDAVDDVFSELLIKEGSSSRTGELDNKIAVLEHDRSQQTHAESKVIEKSNAIRNLAQELKILPDIVDDIQYKSLSSILRKHLTDQDLVFHAEVHGSPFFVVKNVPSSGGAGQPQTSLLEAAQATVSFST